MAAQPTSEPGVELDLYDTSGVFYAGLMFSLTYNEQTGAWTGGSNITSSLSCVPHEGASFACTLTENIQATEVSSAFLLQSDSP